MKKRILHVVESFSTGILQSVAQICNHLQDDFDFAVLHGRREETPDRVESHFLGTTNLILWNVQRAINPVGDARALRELDQAVQKLRPDLLHAHSSKAGALCRLLALQRDLSVIYSPRGYSFLQRNHAAPIRGIYRTLEWGLGRLPHVTVACGIGELLQANAVSKRAIIIPNMIDLADIDRVKSPRTERDGRLIVAMSGSIRPQKNFPLFARIAQDMADEPFDFLWIGGGKVDVQLPPNLTLTSWVGRNEALATLSKAHVFAQTSLWEGLPIALLEAMAFEQPVLAMPGVGNSELVLDDLTGYLCQTPSDFVGRLREMFQNADMRRRLGAAGRAFVERNHSVEANAARWASLYASFSRYEKFGLS